MKKSWLVVFALCASALVLLTPVAYRKWCSAGSAGASLAKSSVRTVERPPAYVRSLRPEYPYSVIPGGAYSPEELRQANAKDNVVRAHYANFDLTGAWVVKLTADRYEYVSYRMQNQIYWTGKKLRIPKGESLLTDGVHFARARCGNRLSEDPRAEISAVEPPASLLLPPEFRPGLASNLNLGEVGRLPVEEQTSPAIAPDVVPFLAPETASNLALAQSQGFQGGIGGRAPSSFLLPGNDIAGLFSRPSKSLLADFPPDGPLTPPATPSPIPEPSSIYLFVITFSVVLWALTRVMAAEEKREPDKAKSSFSNNLD